MTALWIILSLLALLLLLLWLPLGVRFSWRDGVLQGGLYYAFLRVYDFSPEALAGRAARREKKAAGKKQKKQPPPKAADKPGEGKKKKRSALEMARLVWSLILDSRGALGLLRRHLMVYRVAVYGVICREDAHQTAVAYGQAAAFLRTGLSIVSELFRLRRPTVYLAPDFTGGRSRWEITLRVRIRPLFLLLAGGNLLYRVFRTNLGAKGSSNSGRPKRQQRKEGKKHEPAATRQ